MDNSKIQCPFICFCKPSAAHIYTSGPLKLENAPHIVPPIDFAISSDSSDNSSSESGNVLKSCIKKVPSDGIKEAEKKTVKWMDNLGKELTEIREFESSSCLI
ncbi:hypothetical protein ACJIZ3_017659 [Penstemon smallii]|uniref:Uncharacterized protein n=1 Tax=Penstemon smallii TaxID=265156 RepID=A0ABD3SW60_9LAMI